MAAGLLSAKNELLIEQLRIAEAYLESLKLKKVLTDQHSERLCQIVREKFSNVKQAVDKKEKDLISKIIRDGSVVKRLLETSEKSADAIINKSLQVGHLDTNLVS